ncbi:hypothetical protein LCGC14_2703950 [marine sediment metagenome]|uniref:Uncharacterized protein n=1 Tax=marine sediment metagenome TaxID=412755 RepID=A0A0F8ZEY5_9ZZZZ
MKVFIKGFLLGFLTYCAATWAYTFAQILIHGSITYIEPNIPVLITELTVAILVTIGGIILIIRSK